MYNRFILALDMIQGTDNSSIYSSIIINSVIHLAVQQSGQQAIIANQKTRQQTSNSTVVVAHRKRAVSVACAASRAQVARERSSGWCGTIRLVLEARLLVQY